MSDAKVTWRVQLPKGIQRMFKRQPCEAQITRRPVPGSSIVKGYLVLPAQVGVRARDAYQLIVTLEFEDYHAWGLERQVVHAATYLRIAEVKFELEIAKIFFRGKEVNECG